MATPARRRDESPRSAGDPTQNDVEGLVSALGDRDGMTRLRARNALVEMGLAAVPALLPALKDQRSQVRWEATKALGEIADPRTVDPLLLAMEDKDPEVRWLAGGALANLGPRAVAPLLAALTQKADLPQFRAGAHYVLRLLKERGMDGPIREVLEALEGTEPSVQVPVAAGLALVKLSDENLRDLRQNLSGN